MLRSPHAHARFRIADLAKVRAMPGVRLVLTAEDVADLGPLPTPGVIPDRADRRAALSDSGARHRAPRRRRRCLRRCRHARAQAKDAAEAISIDWQPLPHVIGAVAALKSGAPQVWPDRPGNLAFETAVGDEKATREAFAKAARTVEITLVNQRLVTNYLDTRGVIAEYDGERYTLTRRQPGQPRRPRYHLRRRAQDRARQDAGDHARCRRRLRHQALSLPRICAGRGRGRSARASR